MEIFRRKYRSAISPVSSISVITSELLQAKHWFFRFRELSPEVAKIDCQILEHPSCMRNPTRKPAKAPSARIIFHKLQPSKLKLFDTPIDIILCHSFRPSIPKSPDLNPISQKCPRKQVKSDILKGFGAVLT